MDDTDGTKFNDSLEELESLQNQLTLFELGEHPQIAGRIAPEVSHVVWAILKNRLRKLNKLSSVA